MASLANIARMTSTTTGTGAVTLNAAVTSYLTFAEAGIVDGQTVSYAMLWSNQREAGRGVYTAATKTLTRNVLASTNSNSAVNILGQSEWIVTALAEDFAELYAAISNTPAQNTFLVSGGQVVWISALTFRVSAAIYYIAGVQYQSAEQTVTLSAADPALDRIDVIAVNSSATVVAIAGTAAATPSEPDVDPGTQLKLAIVTVAAAAATPSVTNTSLYAENAGSGGGEWDWTTSGAGWTLASLISPHSGIKCIDGTSVAANAYAQGHIGAGSITPSTLNLLVLYIPSKSTWANNRGLQISLRSSGVIKGVAVSINRTGSFGFDSSVTSGYQQIAIPLQQFAIPAGTTINQIRITDFGGAINFRLDDIFFQAGGSTPQPTGLTRTEADALYVPLPLASTTQQLTGTSAVLASSPDSVASLWEQGGNITSASTISIGEGGYFHVTGTTAITDIDFAPDKTGRAARLVFDGVLTLTHNATTLILPTAANITTAAGDSCLVVSEGSDAVRIVDYQRANGGPLTQVFSGAITPGDRAPPNGRLTITTLTPILTVSTTGITTIFYTPYGGGDFAPIFDGTSWARYAFAELSQALSNNTTQPAAIGSFAIADAFVWNNAGTISLCFISWARAQTFTVTVASPAVFSITGHGFFEGMPFVPTTSGALPTGLTAGTTYFVIAAGLTADAFRVSATLGGSVVNTSGTQSGTHTATEKVTAAARGTGAGTAELQLLNGIYVNKNAITNGPAATKGTYVGQIMTNASSQVDVVFGGVGGAGGESSRCHIWNAYNRIDGVFNNYDNTDSWNYTTLTWRIKNGNFANITSFIRGLDEDGFQALNNIKSSNTSAIVDRATGIGMDGTAAVAAFNTHGAYAPAAAKEETMIAFLTQPPGSLIGYHFICGLELSVASGTTTWYGDGGNPANLRCMLQLRLKY